MRDQRLLAHNSTPERDFLGQARTMQNNANFCLNQ